MLTNTRSRVGGSPPLSTMGALARHLLLVGTAGLKATDTQNIALWDILGEG